MKKTNNIKSHLEEFLDEGILKLKNFGFIYVTRDNILTDEVYRFFILRFMGYHRGKNKKLNTHMERLLSIKGQQNKRS